MFVPSDESNDHTGDGQDLFEEVEGDGEDPAEEPPDADVGACVGAGQDLFNDGDVNVPTGYGVPESEEDGRGVPPVGDDYVNVYVPVVADDDVHAVHDVQALKVVRDDNYGMEMKQILDMFPTVGRRCFVPRCGEGMGMDKKMDNYGIMNYLVMV